MESAWRSAAQFTVRSTEQRNSSSSSSRVFARVDERGRISIPADIRRTLGIVLGDLVELEVSLSQRQILITISEIKKMNGGERNG